MTTLLDWLRSNDSRRVVVSLRGMAMNYKDRSFGERWHGAWAAEAQAAYEFDRAVRRVPYDKPGLDRAPFSATALMRAPSTVRYAPDYREEVEKTLRYVEVKGCGRDQVIKLKDEQLNALWLHNEELRVWFCYWNNQTRTLVEIGIEEVAKLAGAAERQGNVGTFDPDTAPKRYFELAWADLAELGEEHALGH